MFGTTTAVVNFTLADVGFLGRTRGDRVTACGSVGTFVGRRGSVDWVAWDGPAGPDGAKFAAMCEGFDGR